MPGPWPGEVVKRLLDLAVSALLLVLLSPVLLVLAVLIRLCMGSPVLFRQVRPGFHARPFAVVKFRTMNEAHAADGELLSDRERLTSLGRFMRRLSLDELPQLWNVLRGDMAVVGPRPEDPQYVASYSEGQRSILGIRPGLTSPASMTYRDEERMLTGADWEQMYVSEVLPEKLALDLDYFRRRSVLSDVVMVWRTIGAVLR